MKRSLLKMSFYLTLFAFVAFSCNSKKTEQKDKAANTNSNIEQRVNDLLGLMTQEEKLGQLAQYSNPYQQTGDGKSSEHNDNFDEMIRKGQIGSFLNVTGVDETLRLQKIAVEESRLKIPLIFGLDVIHGLKTMMPIPLAEAASFDRTAMEKSTRIAAIEAAAVGLHWTFAPMVDISRDPRWGRIMEGAGEDVFLGVEAAKARVKGFQGDNLADANTIAACAKHFVGYGAAIAGRDYNGVDMSDRLMREVYLPPFKAAVDAGVATFMSAFNTLGGVPASGNKYIQTDILRGEWGFDGFVVSDWNTAGELLNHGSAANGAEGAYFGFNAGVDMDMESRLYVANIDSLIKVGKLKQEQLDEAVRRILRVKFRLGLFDNPYQYNDKKKEETMLLTPEHLAASRDIAKRSIVLLKNEKNLLPLSKEGKTIAVIGPLANDKDSPLGNWRAHAVPNSAVSLLEGIKAAVPENTNVLFAEGTKLINNAGAHFFMNLEINKTDRSGFAEAIATAKKADVVVMALGEVAYMSGECRSYADLGLQGLQLELLKEIRKTGKPIVLTLFNGRPMVLTDVVGETDAILNCWLLGSESGNAIADVLFGDYNPSGKLPASFPYHVGQIPIYYEHFSTGRPSLDAGGGFATMYRDIPNDPLFPFGFGLSYTTFEYSGLKISSAKPKFGEKIKITATIKNTGNYDGEEVVQLYIHDVAAHGVARPVKQLKGFEKVLIKKGETVEVKFELTAEDLAFVRLDNSWGAEAGKFNVFVGSASNDLRLKGEFDLIE